MSNALGHYPAKIINYLTQINVCLGLYEGAHTENLDFLD